LKIQENIPLAPLTTLQVGGPARYFAHARSESDVVDALAYAADRRLPLFVLGGGSNLVVSDAGWPGLILQIALMGCNCWNADRSRVFAAGAGENWDQFVAMTVSQNCAGLECLSGIPGTVGGTPVQNVGAYGQEVSETITSVRVLEISSGKIAEWNNRDCGFAYRSSVFNTAARGRYIVLQVTFRLAQNGSPRVAYADLEKFLAAGSAGSRPTLQQVRDAVRSIRHSKAMLIVPGDEDCRSAGSFFKNPVVNQDEAARIVALAQQRAPGKILPQYPAEDGQMKLAAAWLVEQAGFSKGFRRGAVGISRKHSLAIVNRGGASARDIVAFKNEIQQKVFDNWGVELHPEPVFVGFGSFDGTP
jgi:UDP-N-acetylmuramate dehydrogenase